MSLQTLKGFRDFLPAEKIRRDWVMAQIVKVFSRHGFLPLETPTLEYRDTIMGKYGEEADKLVYQFRDNGDREVALRYDQTVPTARVVAQYNNELAMPFRRYQTQNVFRADKPQKGRYREFTQCDIDIFGATSPLADAEILATTYAAYRQIGFTNIELKINDRQVLMEVLSPLATSSVSVFSIIQSIDKLDKMPAAAIVDELVAKGLSVAAAQQALQDIQSAQPSTNLQIIIERAQDLGVPAAALQFTPTIARGLDYYTGMIFEVRLPGYDVGSVGGGGRYDHLIEQLSGLAMPAVGMAFGFDRTVEAAVALNLVPAARSTSQVLVTVFGDELSAVSAQLTTTLRQQGVAAELYTGDTANLGKQFKYANRQGIPYVLVIGPSEAERQMVQFKDMTSGEQTELTWPEIAERLRN